MMMPMSLAEMAQAVGGALRAPQGADVQAPVARDATSDSRQAGAGTVFVAIAGERVDGHDFVADVAARGAVAAIVDHEVDAPVAQIVVDDTVVALGALARHNIERRRALTDRPFTVVGITGSVGKTTTKDLLRGLLDGMGPTVAPVGSFNNEIGLPLTALRVGADTRFLVAEMGANHVGEIARLTSLVPPDVAVVLKVGVAHLGEFGSVERIAQAKREIVEGLRPGGACILNADDGHVAAMRSAASGPAMWFGMDDGHVRSCGLTARDVTLDTTGHPSFVMARIGEDGAETWRRAVTLGIRGAHNVMNALAACCAAVACGMDVDDAADALGRQTRISAHRMEVGTVERDGVRFTLIDDSFNANPDSMRAGITALAGWRHGETTEPYRVGVLGAMLELGGDDHRLHRELGGFAVDSGLDAVVTVGSTADPMLDALAGDLAAGADQAAHAAVVADAGRDVPVRHAHDAAEADAIVTELTRAHGDAVVLLKGSHASGLSALATRWNPVPER